MIFCIILLTSDTRFSHVKYEARTVINGMKSISRRYRTLDSDLQVSFRGNSQGVTEISVGRLPSTRKR
jgi:hypothetical protein